MESYDVVATVLFVLGLLIFFTAPRLAPLLDRYVEGIGESNNTSSVASSESFAPLGISREDLVTWSTSKERTEYVRRRTVGQTRIAASVVGGTAAAVLLLVPGGWDGAPTAERFVAGWAIAVVSLLMLWSAASPYVSARSAFRQRVRASASARVDAAIKAACRDNAGESLMLHQLFELNRRQLDEYQVITQRQQRSAFRLAQVAMGAAFSLILLGVWLALTSTDDIETYVTGGLTAIGTLLSTFLARTFFAGYRDANKQMNLYYLEPQRTGRLMAAERIVTKLPGQGVTTEERAKMVDRVLAWDLVTDTQSNDPDDSDP